MAPGERFHNNWHIDAICHLLRRIDEGEVVRAVIMLPPRSLKSLLCSIAFPAWVLGNTPSKKFICASYNDELSAKLHNDCRLVMTSDWYRHAFPAARIGQNTASEFTTTLRGGRLATSIGGTLTGRGCDILIIDDPLKAADANSAAARQGAINWYNQTALSRLNDKRFGAIIIVMQRLHVDDLAGHVLQQDGWEVLELQAIADEDQVIRMGQDRTVIRRAGEVLDSMREPVDVLLKLKAAMGSMTFSAQYQQRPIPPQGNVIKRGWLRTYDHLPLQQRTRQIVISWDCATSKEKFADFSVGTVWLFSDQNRYVLDLVRGQFDFPELVRNVRALAQRWAGATTLIEQAGTGLSLIQELQQQRCPAIGIKPKGDKADRLYRVSSLFEAGAVHFPKSAAWLDDCRDELLAFPYGRHDDMVDSISQALQWSIRPLPIETDLGCGVVSVPNDDGIKPGMFSNWYSDDGAEFDG